MITVAKVIFYFRTLIMIRSHDSITSLSIRKLNLRCKLYDYVICHRVTKKLLNENNGAVVGRKIKLSVI